MSENFEHMDDLIAKVLAGEALPEEELHLATWVRASNEHLAYYEENKKIFDSLAGLKEDVKVNVDGAWHRLEKRIDKPEARIVSFFSRSRVLRAAAAILFLVTLSFVLRWVFATSAYEPVLVATTNQTLEQKLPDGSKIFLNKNTKLNYRLSNNKKREVELKGEAYFEVKHKEEEPFVIHVDELMIEDIGTAFNVKALPESNLVEVLVEEGEVRMFTRKDSGLNLVKGEKAIYDKTTKLFSRSQVKPLENTTSYKSRIFTFQNTTLSEVIAQVNGVYNADIQLQNPKIGKCRLSVVFNNEQLDEMIAVIAETLNLKIERKGNSILLSGESCPE